MAVSIYIFLKYWAKQKHLLPFHVANLKLRKLNINTILQKMRINNELKGVNIKNCTWYYFDNIIKI